MTVNNGLRSIWKKAAVAYFKIFPNNLHQGTEENHENSQDIRPIGQDSKT
jgi:hypothetical protein